MAQSFRKEYLDLNDAERIKADDSLYDLLEEHPDIERVILFWSVTRDYYTSNASIFSGYVTETKLDEEYSFDGNRESALKYAESYCQWDGHVMLLLMGGKVLYGFYEDYDPQTSWDDGYDHHPGLSKGIDPSWIRLIVVFDDHATGTEYVLEPKKYPPKMMWGPAE